MGSGCKVKHDRHYLKTAEPTISESSHLPCVLDGGGGGMHLDRWVVPRRSVCHERLCAPLRKLTNDISQHEMDIAASRSYSVRSGSSRLGLTVLDPVRNILLLHAMATDCYRPD
jgi:hypothetical protein